MKLTQTGIGSGLAVTHQTTPVLALYSMCLADRAEIHLQSSEFLPSTENSPVLRTFFEDDAAWMTVCDLIRRPVNVHGQDFFAYVEFIDNPIFRDRTGSELLKMIPPEYGHTFLFIVDETATKGPEFPILVMDLWDEPGRTFRVIQSEVQGVENNLSIANMDFRDFADNVEDDGIFRGLKKP